MTFWNHHSRRQFSAHGCGRAGWTGSETVRGLDPSPPLQILPPPTCCPPESPARPAGHRHSLGRALEETPWRLLPFCTAGLVSARPRLPPRLTPLRRISELCGARRLSQPQLPAEEKTKASIFPRRPCTPHCGRTGRKNPGLFFSAPHNEGGPRGPPSQAPAPQLCVWPSIKYQGC